jgi:ankyrin repeat protein
VAGGCNKISGQQWYVTCSYSFSNSYIICHLECNAFPSLTLGISGAQVDALDESGRTPLEIASTYSKYRTAACCGFFKPQCCEILLQSGADPNRVNPEGLTPLNKAGPDGDIIKILLKYGADVTAGTKGVLTSAVEAGDVQTLRIYLENGADCNVPDTSADSSYRSGLQPSLSKRYPLVTAAFLDRSTSIEMIKLLLDHGAGVDLPVSDEETLIHYLFQHTKTSALRPLIEIPGLEFNIRDQKGRTVFMAACNSHVRSESTRGFVPREEENRRRAEYIPAYLLLANSERYGSSIDYLAVDNEGKHIIMYLLPKWDNKVAERFLPIPGVRVLIRQKDNAGFSPLHYALRNHQMRACFQFIKEGNADLLEPDPNGDTALHHLCRCHYMSETQRSLPLMQKFLELDGSINARNKLGETPLLTHLASGYQPHSEFGETKHTDNFSFFISNGAEADEQWVVTDECKRGGGL